MYNAFRACLAVLLLPLLFALPTIAPAAAHGYGGVEHCIVSTEDMDLILIRHDPNGYSKVEKRLEVGECGVHVVDNCRHGWCPVAQGGFRGWVKAHNLAPISPPIYCVTRVDRGWTLDLHVAPARRTAITVSVSGDYCGLQILPQRVGHWQRVRAGGHEGWVSVTNIAGLE